jgi:apolipoprotein N-acyltransferase
MKWKAERFESLMSHWAAAPLSVALSASLYYFGTGLYPLWPITWFAPLPVLFVALRRKWWSAALCAFVAFVLGRMNLFEYAREIGGGSISGAMSGMVLAALIPAVAFMATVLLARYATLKLPGYFALWVFPCAITSYEFVASSNAFTGSLFSIAYSQTDFLSLLQVVSVLGIGGITFLVSLLPSAIATIWGERPVATIVPVAAVILTALAYGGVRLQTDASEPIRVGLVASDDAYQSSIIQSKDAALSIIASYAKPIQELAAQGAQVVLLPEKIIGFAPDDRVEVVETLSSLARAANVSLVVGASRNATPRRNIALVLARDGTVLGEYAKHHLVPGIESGFAAGTAPLLVDVEGVRAGIAICKDNDFPPWLRQYGTQGARMLFVPALDFDVDDRLHARIAMVRAVENGAALARAAGRGRITLSDAYGRIVAERSTAAAPVVTLLDDLQPGPGGTIYSRSGDWFASLCVIALIALLIAARFFSRGKGLRYQPFATIMPP